MNQLLACHLELENNRVGTGISVAYLKKGMADFELA
jgi:hypothetical protein